ncbi:terminase [Nocardioides piscis]|uniref:Terminase n=1 Tax=Nocardioides piscis TaxID=2714938 RepID=A0A6G7YKA8_9ACTN|nr:terminase [Nocardioides piscis]
MPPGTNSERSLTALLGSETPRLATPPLHHLTPDTSLGFEVIAFSERFCRVELMPWQRWWLIHALELRPDGRLRFRRILTLVSRQNGKTHLLKLVALWAMVSGRAQLVLGVAQDLVTARESWQGTIDLTEHHPALTALRGKNAVRLSTGDLAFTLTNGARYKIAPANGRAGRGLSVDLLILDELREHRDDAAWAALSATTTARPDGLIVAISNAGEERSIVLNGLRDSALAGADETLGLFEWSAPDNCELDDPRAWAQANPGLGHTIEDRTLASALATLTPGRFRTEHLCQRVESIETAIDLNAWQACADSLGTMDALRDRITLCLDVSSDLKHVSLVAAGQRQDGRVRVEPVGAWDSPDQARAALPDLLTRIDPRVLGWFPGGPAAALAADLRGLSKTVELKAGDVPSVCQGFAEQVTARRLVHSNDPLLNAHVSQTTKLTSGDGWRFSRRGLGHCDALYAAAGSVHLARTLPVSVGKPRIIVAA